MAKRVRLTNESLNSYGTWIVTAGIDLSQYERNPVLLLMHQRGNVIGYIKDIKVENGEITGEPVFDEASQDSIRAKKQWEFGSIRMVSVGIDIIEMSDDPAMVKPGQSSMTITKSKLVEVSIVDIGANDDAIVLTYNGSRLECGIDGKDIIPRLNNTKTHKMDIKQLALQLGLPETADEATVLAKITELMGLKAENDTLRLEAENTRNAAIVAAVDAAIGEKRLTADKKNHFIELGKKVGLDTLKETLAAMAPATKVSTIITPQNGGAQYKKLSDVPASELAELRLNDATTYARLYKAEYGIDCEI